MAGSLVAAASVKILITSVQAGATQGAIESAGACVATPLKNGWL